MTGYVELFVLFAVLYWLFYRRTSSMADILANTIQKVYSKWDNMAKPGITSLSRDNTHLNQRITVSGLERHSTQLRKEQRGTRKKLLVDEQVEKRQNYEDLPQQIKQLFNGDGLSIKDFDSSPLDHKDFSRPIMGMACKQCIPSLKESLVARSSHQYAIQNVLAVLPQRSYLSQLFCHFASVWQQKNHFYPQVYTTVLDDERLKDAISTAADLDYKEVEEKDGKIYKKLMKKHEKRAILIINNMRTSISNFLLRVTSWLIYKLIPRFLMSVSTHPAQIEMLKSAGESGLPLIFLPLHRSHLDYILISFILLCNDIQAPLVAAGDNLKIPFFGWLLRSLGAFFIKRRLDPVQGRRDTIYRAVLHTYMMECLRTGHNIEFFIEGGRTRTGKPCMPKGGLLSVIVDAYMDGTIADALLVPVSLNYEKLVDGNFVREQMGQPKQMETFGMAVQSIYKVLNSNYGMMRIDFHQPFSLMELVKSFQHNRRALPPPQIDSSLTVHANPDNFHQTPSSASLYGTDICHEEHRQIVESIARHVIYDCAKATAVMSTNAVAFLLLHKYRNGVSLPQLVKALDTLRNDMKCDQRDVGFSGESVDIINHALELLGPGLITKEKQLLPMSENQTEPEVVTMITPITMLPNVIELSYYSNALLSHYLIDAVVVTAIYSQAGEDIKGSERRVLHINHDQLIKNSLEICNILQYEFIFAKPCQEVENLMEDAIERLKNTEILLLDERLMDERQQWSRRYAHTLEDRDEYEDLDEAPLAYETNIVYKMFRNNAMVEELEFLHGILQPLLDVYTVSALALSRLVGRQLTEREYVQEILDELKSQMESGFVQYGESMAVDPIKCSLKLFEQWSVLECHSLDRLKVYYIPDQFDNVTEVRKIFDKINQFKWSPGPAVDINKVYEAAL